MRRLAKYPPLIVALALAGAGLTTVALGDAGRGFMMISPLTLRAIALAIEADNDGCPPFPARAAALTSVLHTPNRRFTMKKTLLGAAALALLPLPLLAQNPDDDVPAAVAVMQNPAGEQLGNVRFLESPSGYLHVIVQLEGMDEGVNAIHLHEVGECEGDFSSAGGHIAGDMEHGIFNEGGPHPGDLPNLHIQSDGVAAAEYFTDRIDLTTMTEGDGSAVIVHALSDDYTSEPAGNADGRLACGVIMMAID